MKELVKIKLCNEFYERIMPIRDLGRRLSLQKYFLCPAYYLNYDFIRIAGFAGDKAAIPKMQT